MYIYLFIFQWIYIFKKFRINLMNKIYLNFFFMLGD